MPGARNPHSYTRAVAGDHDGNLLVGEAALGGLTAAFSCFPRQRTLPLERQQEYRFIRLSNAGQSLRLNRLRKRQETVAPAVSGADMNIQVIRDGSQRPSFLKLVPPRDICIACSDPSNRLV